MNTKILINKIKTDSILKRISENFDEEIYLIGGAVRDIFLNNEIHDRDLIIKNHPKDFALKLSKFFDGTFITLDETNKIYRVVLPDKINYIDITKPIENSLKKDILRRDLTINAVGINIKTGDILDYTGGLKDFEAKVIKGISESNFTDDPLRILRIFRFHSVLGFEIDSETLNIAKKYSNLILEPAKERVEYELMKLFSGKYAHSALLKMDECSILELIFPFVKELKQVPPNHHHHLDLFKHSIETVKQVQTIYENSSVDIKKHMDKIDFGGFSRFAHLKLACFLHDIGKFSTWTIDKDTGRHRFIKHDDIGANMCIPILKNLAFSNKQINYIKTIIKRHMYATMVVSAPDSTQKTLTRYIRKMEENSIDGILIAKADRLSALGPEITNEIVEENLNSLDKLAEFYLKSLESIKPLPKLLDGNEIMKLTGLKPSKKLGDVLKKLHEAQLNGDIETKEQAIEFVTTIIL